MRGEGGLRFWASVVVVVVGVVRRQLRINGVVAETLFARADRPSQPQRM